ncbi:MAG: hypothetical protein OHK0053_12720 [Microscillaceae bacterium]
MLAMTLAGPGQAQETFVIPQGEQRSGYRFGFFEGKKLTFKARFDSTAIYKTQNPENQADCNKLYGFSDCGSFSHHQNSARFGWRWFNDKLEILAYTYVNGERQITFLTDVRLEQTYAYEIEWGAQVYIFRVNGVEKSVPRACSGPPTWSAKLFPFFGGDENAPHSIRIQLEEL